MVPRAPPTISKRTSTRFMFFSPSRPDARMPLHNRDTRGSNFQDQEATAAPATGRRGGCYARVDAPRSSSCPRKSRAVIRKGSSTAELAQPLVAASEHAPRKLRRDIGAVGLLFASLGSIIGAGGLFGALYASSLAGPAAVISWVLGGGVVMLLALTHAELGGMFPVAGGSARFPRFAFGGLVGFTGGWIAFLGAVTVVRSWSRPCFSTRPTTSPRSRPFP